MPSRFDAYLADQVEEEMRDDDPAEEDEGGYCYGDEEDEP